MTSASTENIGVRRALQIDAEHISDFNIAMALETEGKPLDSETVGGGVRAVLSRNDLGFYVVAEHRDKTVGQLLITYEWSDWRNAFFWWIQSVYVAPEHRHQGVYKALHAYVSKSAGSQGDVCGIRLYVDKDNKIAQGVYAGFGMSETNYYMYEIEF